MDHPDQGLGAYSAYGLRAKIPTIPSRRDMSTGFAMWY